MSTTVGMAGYSIKLNDEDQSEKRLKEIAKSLGFTWENNLDWDDIVWDAEKYMNSWKPNVDVNGVYGFIYVTHYEWDAADIEYYCEITDLGLALKDFMDKTNIMPQNKIKSFAIIYYNGVDNPFKY